MPAQQTAITGPVSPQAPPKEQVIKYPVPSYMLSEADYIRAFGY